MRAATWHILVARYDHDRADLTTTTVLITPVADGV
jgi:hypothetical protein